jgi:DUF1680 family protein
MINPLVLLALLHHAATPAASPAKLAIEPFDYTSVRIDGGPLRTQIDTAREDYLRIPNDDLLKGFRWRAGKPAPGVELGGWYSDDVFHVFGQIISGLARLHAATGDPACRAKAEALVAGWAACIELDGYFYYSRKPNAPHYIYDKMVGGLTDMIVYCDSKPAAEALEKITAWAIKHLERSNAYAFGGTEWYTLSENLYRAYRATGDHRYADFAAVWHYREYWDLFAAKKDIFADRGGGRRTAAYHAYSHVNTLGGLAHEYLHTGQPELRDALIRAHDTLVAEQCYPTGGFGPDEQLLPRDAWKTRVDTTHNSFETQCGCFAVFKLCKYLTMITGDGRFGDWPERLVYNGIAAAIPMSPTGNVFYYSDYNAFGGAKRNHGTGWTCCTGTRPMALADLCGLVYFHDGDDNLHVNLFVPSTLHWNRSAGAVAIRQETRFPELESTELIVSTDRPTSFAMKFRVPVWLAGPLAIRVNDQPVSAVTDDHGWATIHREWRDGDRVVVPLPMKFDVRRLDSATAGPAMLLRGPVALAARSRDHNPGELLQGGGPEANLSPIPGDALSYRLRSNPDVLVRPLYDFKQGEPYFLYLDANRHSHRDARFTGDGWRESEAFRFNDRPGESVTFDFEGTGIRWIGFRFDDAGRAEVWIDDTPIATVDQYSPGRGDPFEWIKSGLNAGKHRLKITIRDDKPASSKGRFINIAGFEAIQGE